MILVDTHTHLYLDDFDNDRNEVIENAIKNGVQKMFLPNISLASISPMLDLCKLYPNNCFAMIGVHPSNIRENFKNDLEIIENSLKKEKFCAVGEIGIDLYWDKTFKEEQIFSFEYQINLAQKYNLPIVIHARDAFKEVFDVLEKYKNENLKGIFHCFSGTLEQAKKIIDWGFKLGIGGIVSFKNAGLDKIVKEIDLKHLVLETDAPYLAPVPKRGKRNESSYILHIAQKIADIKNVDIEEVAEITTKNAMNIFK